MRIDRVPLFILFAAAMAFPAFAQQNATYSADQHPSIAKQTYKIAADSVRRSAKPTELYKLAAGDVLQISLENALNTAGYYTIRQDGSIDFPLAGEDPMVEGMTLEEAEDALSAKITLYPNAHVTIGVRDYASHKITVTGMASLKGERSLRREAMPLFTIRADAGVDPSATKVLIRRTDMAKPEVYALNEDATGDVLVYPGSIVEFAADAGSSSTKSFFYIAGQIASPGQREMHSGMSLMQAVMASGGTTSKATKAAVRRKSSKGTLTVAEYDLRRILDGRSADPLLEPGDMIEITD